MLKELIKEMLLENTGTHMLDSGFDNGRHWQKNQNRNLVNEPAVTIEDLEDLRTHLEAGKPGEEYNGEFYPIISTYHYLTESAGLELDELCEEFNTQFVPALDWEGNYYGISKDAQNWLVNNDFEEHRNGSFNTYNGNWNGDQTLQGTYLENQNNGEAYVLLQIHNGADVRGGYTDARLFHLSDEYLREPHASASLNDKIMIDTYGSSYGGEFVDDSTGDPRIPQTLEELEEFESSLTINEY